MKSSFAIAFASVSAFGVHAVAANESTDLSSQLTKLKAEIAELQGGSSQWLTEQRAAEIVAGDGRILGHGEPPHVAGEFHA